MQQRTARSWIEEVDAYRSQYGHPHREAASQYDKDAVEFAKLIIQALLLLHGGALVAIPAFVAFRPNVEHCTLVALLILLSAGLITALMAGICAFFAAAERSKAHFILGEAIEHRGWARAAQLEFFGTQNPLFKDGMAHSNAEADAIDKKAQPAFRRFNFLRGLAVLFVFLSFLALVTASSLAAIAI